MIDTAVAVNPSLDELVFPSPVLAPEAPPKEKPKTKPDTEPAPDT